MREFESDMMSWLAVTEGYRSPDACACSSLRKAARAATRMYDRCLQPSGLTTAQFSILSTIQSTGPVTMSHLAGRLAMDRTSLTRLLAPLRRQRLVSLGSCGRDGRLRLVEITASGSQAVAAALPLWQEAQSSMEAELGAPGWRRLRSSLHDAIAAARACDGRTGESFDVPTTPGRREAVGATVEFYFDYGSPTSYIAYKRLPAIAARTNAQVIYKPVLLGGIMKACGNTPPSDIPAKANWLFADLSRTAQRHSIPYRKNPSFPMKTLTLMRGAIAMRQRGKLLEYSDVVFTSIWSEGRDLSNREVIAESLAAAGFDAKAFFEWCEDGQVKSELKEETEAAIARGVFGAPTFIVGGELHFGQDRLDFVEEALGTVSP